MYNYKYEVSVIKDLRQEADDREQDLKRFFTEHLDVALDETTRRNMGYYHKSFSEMRQYIIDTKHEEALTRNSELTSTPNK
tara:strand:- start:470 stop:712 length:243 start_codon:yes stop_codon:yes gene_type:complete